MCSLKSTICFGSLQAAYHQRMDVLTNMGLMCLFAFAACLKQSEIWDSNVHVYLACYPRPFNPVGFLLRQGGWCLGPQHGWQCHAAPGYSCVLVLFAFHTDWHTTKYDRYPAGMVIFCIRASLRSRGSTHRSYWRAEGVNFVSQPIQPVATSKMPHIIAFWFGSWWLQISQPQLQETWHTQVWNWETGFAGECVTCVLAVAIPEKLRGVYLHCIVSYPDISSSTFSFLKHRLRLMYLSKKGVTFAIENPTTSLLFRYRPLRETLMQDFWILVYQSNISLFVDCFDSSFTSHPCAIELRSCSRNWNASRSWCLWGHLAHWHQNMSLGCGFSFGATDTSC